MKKILVILLLFISSIAATQNSNALFADANTLYKEGKYIEAIDKYNLILEQGNVSSELFFNLGNCYYKLNKVAPTIYNYERALQLDPLNKDAQNNLIYAKRLTLDRIEALPKSVFQKINKNFLQKFSYNTWAIFSIVLSILASVLFLFFYFSYSPNQKRLYFSTSIISFLLLAVLLIITFNQYNQAKNNIQAIIFPEQIEVKNAPTENSDEVFTLHEGTKVKVLDTVDNWKKIKLADGKIGWTLSSNLKEF